MEFLDYVDYFSEHWEYFCKSDCNADKTEYENSQKELIEKYAGHIDNILNELDEIEKINNEDEMF